MKCPKCNHNHSRVIDSRQSEDAHAIRRRRECESCRYRFTTFEKVEKIPLLVIKKDNSREEFSREKLLRGLIRSAEKRPVTSEQMENMVDIVERRVHELGETEITSAQIGEFMMEELVNLDEIAYIRFASVYRQFKDMTVFLSELEDIVKRVKKGD
ncbi:MAG: transcriptional regulator NrdR [Streptococcaceae bacterium]|jgi:transcriptional repressor NrdR|nr:transcriptional regulator NrdR [Streptococcaceae bacterium]